MSSACDLALPPAPLRLRVAGALWPSDLAEMVTSVAGDLVTSRDPGLADTACPEHAFGDLVLKRRRRQAKVRASLGQRQDVVQISHVDLWFEELGDERHASLRAPSATWGTSSVRWLPVDVRAAPYARGR